jgi:hypothetical protein
MRVPRAESRSEARKGEIHAYAKAFDFGAGAGCGLRLLWPRGRLGIHHHPAHQRHGDAEEATEARPGPNHPLHRRIRDHGQSERRSIAKVDYDKDGAFYSKGLATCNPSQFTSATTTAQAKSACAASQIGGGSAKILIPTGPSTPPLNVSAVITVFNGKSKTIILHTYNSLSGAQTLVGSLGPSTGGSKYGTTLTVPVPPLAGGTAVIQEFNATIHKTYRFKGKKRSVFSAKCGPDKKFNFQARTTFSDGTSSTGTDAQKCKQKG